jgi:protein-tyrosine-phosphatase
MSSTKMKFTERKFNLSIWVLGFGYFVFYTPYSGLTKAVTNGLLEGMPRPLSGFELLPLSVMTTVLGIYSFITVMGWWKYANHRNILGFNIPFPTRATFISGLCMATIIATTTLAFSFSGASILFVLILLRGGVLLIGPVVDTLFGRKVRWFSWAAMFVSLLSLLVALADVHNYELKLLAVLDVAAYLAGYFFRLRLMTRLAKSADHEISLRYFVEEQMVATPALVALLLLLAAIGTGDILSGFRWGFTGIWHSNSVMPAMLVGGFYAALMICTTFIFLDRRENTFCIPMHCGSSMLSGVVASGVLAYLYHQNPASMAQYASTGLIVVALAFLSPLHHGHRVQRAFAIQRLKLLIYISKFARKVLDLTSAGIVQAAMVGLQPVGSFSMDNLTADYPDRIRRILLFVCSGNTCRSPMAEAIANTEIAIRMNSPFQSLDHSLLRAMSAGIQAKDGIPMPPEVQGALQKLGVSVYTHSSRFLTVELVEQAEVVYCMTRSQRDAVIKMYSPAAGKTQCLDPGGDIEDPVGLGEEAYIECARRIQMLIRLRLNQVDIAV